MKQIFIITWLTFLCVGCAGRWEVINQDNQHVNFGNIAFELPVKWMLNNAHKDLYITEANGVRTETRIKQIILSLNGMGLDRIDVMEFDASNAFPSIGKSISESTLSYELAELWIAEQKNRTDADAIKIIKNDPARIAEIEGFTVQYQIKNSESLEFYDIAYGFLVKDKFYVLNYRAPSIYYFEHNYSDYINIIKSISINTEG